MALIGQAAALSCSHWRMIETVSPGFLSASSPTFCTDWAWTWPWTWAMSIIAEVRLEMATASPEPALVALRPPAAAPAHDGRAERPGQHAARGAANREGAVGRREDAADHRAVAEHQHQD